jgi:hypothetical protein
MSFADEKDPDVAKKAPCELMTSQQLDARATLMSRRINACTRGILEVDLRNAKAPHQLK